MPLFAQMLEWLALVAACLAVGILGYVGGSFVLMRAHTEPRPLGRVVREALRETLWAALTQPLLPLFYFVGRRLARAEGGVPVVMVHGYTQNRVDFLLLARACARAGLGPVYGFNYPWFATVHDSAARLARFVDDVKRETGAAHVDLVAHSLGGLVAVEYLRAHGGVAEVRRLVTIASPHAGVPWRGPILGACGPQMREGCAFLEEHARTPLDVPCLSVYSTHDNVVHPPRTSALAHRGALDRAVEHVGHLAILFDPEVARACCQFLADSDAPAASATAPALPRPTAAACPG
jgi:pimeloyl-ACP methyl ester carboxylesterase